MTPVSTVGPVVVLGGGSLVADYLVPRLARRSATVHVVSRRAAAPPAGGAPVALDRLRSGEWRCPTGAAVVSLMPLPALVPLLPLLVEAQAIVALGSTRLFTNAASPDSRERAGAQALADAEAELARWSQDHAVPFTVLRPTLIYDMKGDLNLARMAGFIRRYGMLPLARPARGLRQPIHADDVAKAVAGALGNPAAANRAFDVAGAERLTYRAMAERVFASVGRRPRLLMLPTGLLRLGFAMAGRFGLVGRTSFGSSVFQRMNEDLVADIDEGIRVLGYDPRGFEPAGPHDAVARG